MSKREKIDPFLVKGYQKVTDSLSRDTLRQARQTWDDIGEWIMEGIGWPYTGLISVGWDDISVSQYLAGLAIWLYGFSLVAFVVISRFVG